MHNTNVAPEWKSILTDQLFWFALLLGSLLGMVVSFLPPTFPALADTFGASFEQLGRTQLVFFGAGLSYSLWGGWFTARIGLRWATVASFIFVVAGMLCIALGETLGAIFVGAALNGVGHVGIATSGSTIISNCYPQRRQTIFIIWGITASLGFAVGPASLGWWLEHADVAGIPWQPGLLAFAGVYALIALWAGLLRTTSHRYDETGHGNGAGSREVMAVVLRSPVYYIASSWIFLHALAQIGISSWIGLYYRERFGISVAQAAWFLSANAMGFFVGRLILSWIAARRPFPELVVLTVSASMAGLLFAATIMAPNYPTALVAFFVAGVFTSGDAPSIQSYFGLRFAAYSATAFALLGGVGNIGAAAGPYVIGVVGTHVGLKTGIWLMPGFMILLGATAWTWRIARDRTAEKTGRADSAPQPATVEHIPGGSPTP